MAEGLEIGGAFSNYRIVSKIGVGGMGEVYLAEDSELGRQVALKVLLSEVAGDEDRVRRFIQEAKAASALNHPNILTVYQIGSFEDSRYIATELIKGETLRDRLRGDALSLRDVLDVALQVAAALNAAHNAGIVHRDIKPENIMLRDDGIVKVLDFGLAKLAATPIGPADSEDATRAQVNTRPGVVMGTVVYMSPEQARGKETDARSDVWSLGVVMYEMLTKQTPFMGETASDSIAAILTKEPAPLDEAIPSELRRIVRKSLQKQTDERYQTVKDLLLDVKNLKRELEFSEELERSHIPHATGSSNVSTAQMSENATAIHSGVISTQNSLPQHPSSAEYLVSEIKNHKIGVFIAAAVLLVILVAGGIGLYKFVGGSKSVDSDRKMQITRLVTGLTGRPGAVSISPDGKYVAYALWEAGKAGLWVRQVSQETSLQIVPPVEGASFGGTTFSKDGELIYFVIGNIKTSGNMASLYQIPVLGGREPKKIVDDVDSAISFSPDGKQFAFGRNNSGTGESALIISNTDGSGEARKLASRQGDDWLPGGFAWSPDGKKIAFIAATTKGGTSYTLIEVPVEGGQETLITDHKWTNTLYRAIWIDNGAGLIVNGVERADDPIQIWHISYPSGEVQRVTNDLNDYGSASLSVTADSKTIATLLSDWSSKIWVAAPNDDESHAKRITNGKQDGTSGLATMPDGRIVYAARVGDNSDIWIMNADGTGARALTSDAFTDSRPTVSPDGHYIFYQSSRPDNVPHIWRMDADGSNPKQLTSGTEDRHPAVSPDGRWVAFHTFRTSKATLWKVPIDGGEPVQISDRVAFNPIFSPDGKMLSCWYFDDSVSPPRNRQALISFENGQLVRVIDLPTTAGNVQWSADGKDFLYIDAPGDISNIWSQPVAGGTSKQLTKFTSEFIDHYDISRDGKHFIVSRMTGGNDIILIKNFR